MSRRRLRDAPRYRVDLPQDNVTADEIVEIFEIYEEWLTTLNVSHIDNTSWAIVAARLQLAWTRILDKLMPWLRRSLETLWTSSPSPRGPGGPPGSGGGSGQGGPGIAI